MRHHDVLIIGGGLYGSIIGQHLAARFDVAIVDDSRPLSGSKPAACLIKPSWISGLGVEVTNPSLNLLDRHYGLQTLDFVTHPGGLKTKVHWVPPSSILNNKLERYRAKAIYIKECVAGIHVNGGEPQRVGARYIILATGMWLNELAPRAPKVIGKIGTAVVLPEARIAQPFIQTWRPYNQVVAFNREDGLWCGDGLATNQDRWNDKVEMTSARREIDALGPIGLNENFKLLTGARPYVKDAKPCLLEHPETWLFIAGGGAKNGTIGAAWCAHMIGEMLR